MLPLDVIKKYYPNLSDAELKEVQVFIYELCCGLMQNFYGRDWEEDSEGLDLENKEGRSNNLIMLIMSSNPKRVLKDIYILILLVFL